MVKSNITEHLLEFKCNVCGYSAEYPSPESVALNPNVFHWPKKFVECTLCLQLVCKQCISDKKKKICNDCIEA